MRAVLDAGAPVNSEVHSAAFSARFAGLVGDVIEVALVGSGSVTEVSPGAHVSQA